jgi:hypothetical protein
MPSTLMTNFRRVRFFNYPESLGDGYTVPLGRDGQAERPGGGRGGIHRADGRRQLHWLDARPGNHPGDGHVFGPGGAVGGIVSPMVGGDDDQRFTAQAVGIKGVEQSAQRLVRPAEDAQLFERKPAVLVPHAVGGRKMNEQDPEVLWELFDDAVGDDGIAVVDIFEYVRAGWLRDLAELFLPDEHGGL